MAKRLCIGILGGKCVLQKKQGGMGFRDLHCFNLAMLAKQIWRLVEAPESLCGQILRAKYYPSRDLLKAELKKGASFTWQSLMAGMGTFKRGYIWRVGNGSEINVWHDPWLPNNLDKKVSTRQGGIMIGKVQELINPTTCTWDVQLLEDNFYPIDERRIQAIPLPPWEIGDSIVWHGTKNGIFSVKSAYHMEWQHQYGSRARRRDEAGSSAINPVWDICWKLIVPAKVRIFTWRALHGIIPCMCTLANRHIGGSGQCHVCDWGAEDIAHMMFKCDRALEVWEVLGLTNIIQSAALEDRSGSVVLEHLLRSRQLAIPGLSGLEVKEVIATAAWFIWWRRRELKHNGTTPIPSRLALSIKAMVSNSLRAKKNMSGMIRKGWTKPPSGKVNLNTDAAVNLDTRTASTGCIIRDSQG